MKTKYDETKEILENLNSQFLDDGVLDYQWNYLSAFTKMDLNKLSKTHIITYDVVQNSNEDKTLTEVVIFKEREE